MRSTKRGDGRRRVQLSTAIWASLAFSAGAAAQTTSNPNASQPADTCLLVSAENIVTGSGNWYAYVEFSHEAYTFEAGDRLEYDILLPSLNPLLQGGVDADFTAQDLPDEIKRRPWLRDCGFKDGNNLLLHGDAVLTPARDQWYHRVFDVSSLAGVRVERWTVVFEGDKPGRYVQLLDNIRVTRAGRTVCSVYADGPPPETAVRQIEGYSRTVLTTAVPRDRAMANEQVLQVLEQARRENELRAERDRFHAELDVARELAKRLGDDKLQAVVAQAAALEDADAYAERRAETYWAALHGARGRLAPAHAEMQKFTGHLVGHAHIDLQWLWTWDETVHKIIPETFGQALKFMAEFPGFTFAQSSAALYVATEEHYPDLFRQIQEREKAGQWEIVGGRWCEGDMNMISPEAHARHLLYAQRYFQSRFGHICRVGWEPDTFGHCWTMPQILKKGGIDTYYFCRAGKGVPLFWWEAPDGSRVLAFEEPATGGWYNDGVDDDKVRELARFVQATGGLDHLMVYGVGNHGGGPTREYIEAALAMRERTPWPVIKFSTAGEFFRRLSAQIDPEKLPVIRTELNPVFEGCYSSHSRIKRYNRDCEAMLESAEVFAAQAGGGTDYPRAAFEEMWRQVLWNHHHDTLPGSFIHASALDSARMYEALLARARGVWVHAERILAERQQLPGNATYLVVFNPLAWTRNEVVEAYVTLPAPADELNLIDEQGEVPVQVLIRHVDGDVVTTKICFVARDVPGCGLKAIALRPSPALVRAAPLLPRPAAAPAPAQLQVLTEKPHGMSAWTLGEFGRVTELKEAAATETLESGPIRWRVRETYRTDKSTIVQDRMTYAGQTRVDFDTTVEWLEMGNERDGGPMLKVAVPTGLKVESATYDIPFGDIDRPNDGHENVALKWCAVSDGRRSVAVLNDCKHAYDVKDGVIRLTLLRSSYDPDPTPDVGTHRMRYAVWGQSGALDKAAVVRAAWEFNRPLDVLVVQGSGSTGSPTPTRLGCTAEPANIIVTCLKRAEDDKAYILRAYECTGRPTEATFTMGFPIGVASETDLLERQIGYLGVTANRDWTVTAPFKPYEIRTLRLYPHVK